MTLRELEPGKSGIVTLVGGEGALRQHFLDMGIIPGTLVRTVKYAPLGDPVQIRLHGYELTLRLADAEQIGIDPDGELDPEDFFDFDESDVKAFSADFADPAKSGEQKAAKNIDLQSKPKQPKHLFHHHPGLS